ncbi:MAG TPA: helix-turn-helix domain-containing protein [Chloroflexaceae bacterium]|nr:helix-turn-helix domain-containing protein [Chloroflexaceae bacterium]
MTATHLSVEALHEELARTEGELRLVAEVSDMIGRAAPLRAILDRIAARVAELLATPYAAILLLTLDGRQMTIEGASGLAEPYIAVINRHGLARNGLAGLPSLEVCRSGRPMVWDDMPSDPHLAHFHEAQRLQGISSMVAVPLRGPGGAIGTLNCYHPQPGHFVARDVELLARVAAHAAGAIHNARLVERLNASVSRLSQMNRVVQGQNATLARADAIHRRLTALVLDEGGLAAIVQTLAGLLGCGVALYDAQLAPLTSAPAPRPDAPAPVSLDQRLVAPPAGRRAITGVARGPGVSGDALLCPVSARGKTMGFLAVPDCAATTGELERRTLEHAATVCAVELLRQRVGQEVAWRQRAALFDDLLAGRLGADELDLRARQLGVSLEGPHRLLLVGVADEAPAAGERHAGDLRRLLAELVGREAHQRLPRALVAVRGAQVAALLPCQPGAPECADELMRAVAEAGRQQTPPLALAGGLSGPAEGAAGFARAYGEASEALAVLARLGSDGSLLRYDEVGVLGLLVRGGTRDELLRLARRHLDALLAYEARRGVGLVATLECYLRSGCNPQRAAEQLFVHPNTVKHRLRLIAAHTGANLDDMGQLLELQLALLVRRLQPGAFAG